MSTDSPEARLGRRIIATMGRMALGLMIPSARAFDVIDRKTGLRFRVTIEPATDADRLELCALYCENKGLTDV